MISMPRINSVLIYCYRLLGYSAWPWIEHHDRSYSRDDHGLRRIPERPDSPHCLPTPSGQRACFSTWWFSFSNFDASDYTYLACNKTASSYPPSMRCHTVLIPTTMHSILDAGAKYPSTWVSSFSIDSWFDCTADDYRTAYDTEHYKNHY